MNGEFDHGSPVRSDLVREHDSDQRTRRNKEQLDVWKKNWSEPCAWSICVCVCVCMYSSLCVWGRRGESMLTCTYVRRCVEVPMYEKSALQLIRSAVSCVHKEVTHAHKITQTCYIWHQPWGSIVASPLLKTKPTNSGKHSLRINSFTLLNID